MESSPDGLWVWLLLTVPAARPACAAVFAAQKVAPLPAVSVCVNESPRVHVMVPLTESLTLKTAAPSSALHDTGPAVRGLLPPLPRVHDDVAR